MDAVVQKRAGVGGVIRSLVPSPAERGRVRVGARPPSVAHRRAPILSFPRCAREGTHRLTHFQLPPAACAASFAARAINPVCVIDTSYRAPSAIGMYVALPYTASTNLSHCG